MLLIVRSLEGLSHKEVALRIDRYAGTMRMFRVRSMSAISLDIVSSIHRGRGDDFEHVLI